MLGRPMMRTRPVPVGTGRSAMGVRPVNRGRGSPSPTAPAADPPGPPSPPVGSESFESFAKRFPAAVAAAMAATLPARSQVKVRPSEPTAAMTPRRPHGIHELETTAQRPAGQMLLAFLREGSGPRTGGSTRTTAAPSRGPSLRRGGGSAPSSNGIIDEGQSHGRLLGSSVLGRAPRAASAVGGPRQGYWA